MSDHTVGTSGLNGSSDGTEAVSDVIVVGAGLAGLTSAIALRQRGYSVLVLERRAVAGGLCGSVHIDGYEFTLGCNDFGSAIQRYLDELGIQLPFHEHHSVFHCGREKYVLPPTFRTKVNFARHAPDVIRLVRALRDPAVGDRFDYLGQLVNAVIRSTSLADFISVVAYVAGMSPADYRLDWFRQTLEKNPDYGYDTLITPVDGPQAITDALTARLAELGGRLVLGTEVLDVQDADGGKLVATSRGTYRARRVVSSHGRIEDYPTPHRPNLELGTLHLATRPDVRFPPHTHTVGHLPPRLERWLGALDAGKLPNRFGFHIFPCAATEEYRSFNVYFYHPRGVEEFDTPTMEAARKYILEQLENMIPGLPSAVIFQRFVSPKQFRQEHGLPRRTIQAIPPPGVEKPDIYNEKNGIYYIGNTVGPPAYHACAAVLSGLESANLLATSGRSTRKVKS